MGKLSKKEEREQWTRLIEGPSAPKKKLPKYGNVRINGYDSKHEAAVAANLQLLASRGMISELKEQVRFVLVPGDGKIAGVTYIADFTYRDKEGSHVLDAKGCKTTVYKLKKRMMWLLLKIQIEEV